MKNITKSGFGIGTLIFVAAAIIALPIRTLQYFTVLESDSGFFSENDWSVFTLGIAAGASILAILVLGFLKRKKLDYSLEVTKRPGQGILSFTAAAGILMSAVDCLVKIMNDDSFAAEEKTASLLLGIQAVFALFSAIYFVALGASYLTGKSNGSEYRLISLAPVVWSIFRLVIRFTRTISYIRVSDLMLEMIMIVLLIMFFMAFAQVNSRVDADNKEWKIAAFGLPAALLALICFVPRFIVTVTGNADLLHEQSPAEYCDLGVALFIISTVLTRVTVKLPEASSTEEK
ncbi:MAG: hypothetical protein IJZ07_08820 [Clostridia bacterium]|nr:hypothetical protein [Clostridia bacterium]